MQSYFFHILFLLLPPGFYSLIEETGLVLLKQFSSEKKAFILSKCQESISSLSVVCRF